MQSTDRRNQMDAHLKWTHSLVLAALALVAVAGRALAQTPEGTVITNTATATYTDANNNAYSAVSGSVSVTVGFKAGVTVTANTPTPSSASPSTADTMTFTAAYAGDLRQRLQHHHAGDHVRRGDDARRRPERAAAPGERLLVHVHRPEQRQRERQRRPARHEPGLAGHHDRFGERRRRRQHAHHTGARGVADDRRRVQRGERGRRLEGYAVPARPVGGAAGDVRRRLFGPDGHQAEPHGRAAGVPGRRGHARLG